MHKEFQWGNLSENGQLEEQGGGKITLRCPWGKRMRSWDVEDLTDVCVQ
jgi:hypothetical protein